MLTEEKLLSMPIKDVPFITIKIQNILARMGKETVEDLVYNTLPEFASQRDTNVKNYRQLEKTVLFLRSILWPEIGRKFGNPPPRKTRRKRHGK